MRRDPGKGHVAAFAALDIIQNVDKCTCPHSFIKAWSPRVVKQTGNAAFGEFPKAELLMPRAPMCGWTGSDWAPALACNELAATSCIGVARTAF